MQGLGGELRTIAVGMTAMNKDSSAADFIACAAILAAIISGSINVSQWLEINRLSQLTDRQAQRIEVMEKTILLVK